MPRQQSAHSVLTILLSHRYFKTDFSPTVIGRGPRTPMQKIVDKFQKSIYRKF